MRENADQNNSEIRTLLTQWWWLQVHVKKKQSTLENIRSLQMAS